MYISFYLVTVIQIVPGFLDSLDERYPMGKMCELVLQCNQEKVHKQVVLVVPPFIQFLRLDQAEGQEEPLLGGVEGQLSRPSRSLQLRFVVIVTKWVEPLSELGNHEQNSVSTEL